MPRVYEPWVEKHKAPRGFGSHCPALPDGRAQAMLDAAVPDPNSVRNPPALYFSDGECVYVAHAHGTEVYHGYPVPGREAPPSALKALMAARLITDTQFRRLLKQAAVPGEG